MVKLIVTENGARRTLELPQGTVEIGRGPENQVVIADPRSSRKHCRLSPTPQGWVLEDLKSRNGTLMNGAAVERSLLRPGDEFRIGGTSFRLENGAAEAPPAAPPAAPREAAPRAPARTTRPAAPAGVGEEASDLPLEGLVLEGTEGPLSGKRFPVASFPFTIGRKRESTLRVEDARASGRHAQIVDRGGRFVVVDLESRNGTLLNGKRIREGALTQGAALQIGDSVFRVELSGAAAERAAAEPAELPVAASAEVAEDDFARFDARELLEGGERASALLAAGALLLVLGTVLYFAIDVTLRIVRPRDPDPAPEGNLVQNWSFEARTDGPAVPGFSLLDHEAGSLGLGRDGARSPGQRALRLTPSGEGLLRAATPEIAVEGGSTYRLSGHVKNLGAFSAGILVAFLGESGGQRVEVGRDWGPALREDIPSQDLERQVKAPALARFARVEPFVLACGGARGGAAFDQIFFGPSAQTPAGEEPAPAAGGPEATAGEEEDEEEGPPRLPFEVSDGSAQSGNTAGNPRGLPIRLTVAPDGVLLGLRRGPRPVAEAIWVGLPPESDPGAVGQRLLTTPRQAGEREGVLLLAQLPDTKEGRWFPLESRVRGQGGEIVCELRVSPARGGGLPERAAFYVLLGPTVKEAQAFGGTSPGAVRLSPGKAASGSFDELVFGSGAEQVALLFSAPIEVSFMPHPEVAGRTLLVASAVLPVPGRASGAGAAAARAPDPGVRILGLRISPFSRRENQAVAALLEEAGADHREGRPVDARRKLRDLQTSYPWRQGDVARALELEKAWDAEAERALEDVQAGIEDLKRSPSPVIRDALLARVTAFEKRHQGSPSEGALRAREEEIRRLAAPAASGPAAAKEAPAELLKRSQDHLEREELGLADLWLGLARAAGLDGELKKVADHVDSIILVKRSRLAETGGR